MGVLMGERWIFFTGEEPVATGLTLLLLFGVLGMGLFEVLFSLTILGPWVGPTSRLG